MRGEEEGRGTGGNQCYPMGEKFYMYRRKHAMQEPKIRNCFINACFVLTCIIF